MKHRITDVSERFIGTEPTFTSGKELTKEELITALNWYNSMRDSKDAKKYFLDSLSSTERKQVGSVADSECKTVGYLSRMISRGAKLSPQDLVTYQTNRSKLLAIVAAEVEVKKPNVQDFVKASADRAITKLEDLVDSRKTSDTSIAQCLEDVKSIHVVGHIVAWVAKQEAEFTEALESKDAQIKEGYSNYTKAELRTTLECFRTIRAQLERRETIAKLGRKPRVKKTPSAQKVTETVKYLKADEKLGVASIHPSQIVGAKQLWVFNVKYRKLGVLIATDPQGLTVKGTTVYNFDEARSYSKTVRKPEVTLPLVVKTTRPASILVDIKATTSPITGRLSEDVLLLKVIK